MTEDQATGMLVGLAVGDALGTYLEFGPSREPDDKSVCTILFVHLASRRMVDL